MADKKPIEISRSFSQKIQIREYEPIEFFCSVKAEILFDGYEQTSKMLDNICQEEVEKSIKIYYEKLEGKIEQETKRIRDTGITDIEKHKEQEEREKELKGKEIEDK